MARKLVIHVGTHKTGTTAIQRALKHTVKGDGLGFTYITSKDVFKKISKIKVSSEELVSDQLIDELYEAVLTDVEEAKNNSNIFVISYEGLSGNPLSGYANSPKIANILHKALVKIFSDIKVVIYLRRQDAFVESLYTQYIHQGKSWSFNEFVGKFGNSAFNWRNFCFDFESLFGQENVFIRPYDKGHLYNGDLVEDFSQITDLTISKSPDEKINQGYSREALEIARICNAVFSPEEKKKLRNLLQTTNSKQPFSSYNFFSIDDRAKFLSQYSESNHDLANKLSIPGLFGLDIESDSCGDFNGLNINLLSIVVMRALINK